MTAWPPGILLAEQAHDASQPIPCCLCDYAALRGQRVARMIDGTGWAHVGCIDQLRPGGPA